VTRNGPTTAADREWPEIDTSVAHPARVYDYWLGGKANFAADRQAAEQVLAARPGLRFSVRANRAFLARAVRLLAGELAIRQFLDIGTGIPNTGIPGLEMVHEIAQAIAPEARVVYMDNDPIVLAYAHKLKTSTAKGATDYIQGDLRDPDMILREAARTLDFGKPVAIMLLGVLHLISDEEDPYQIVARLMDAVPSGSYLVLSHPANDLLPETQPEATRRYNQYVSTTQRLRSHDEVARFFNGLELLEPGITQWHQWRVEPDDSIPADAVSGHAGVARKP
jgi:S-adenosyl methyltransferase